MSLKKYISIDYSTLHFINDKSYLSYLDEKLKKDFFFFLLRR